MPDDAPTDDETERLLEAMTIWEHHMKEATEKWHEGVRKSAEEYRRGLAEGLDVDPEDVPDEAVEHWQESVMETGPEEFAASITDEGDDWLVGLYEGVTGREPTPEIQDLAREVEREVAEQTSDDASDEELVDSVRQAVRRRKQEAEG